jgi:carboxyl-terminal processing protease
MYSMSVKLGFLKVRKIILSVLILIGVFVGGYYLGVGGYRLQVTKALNVSIDRKVPVDKNVDFSLFWQVWDLMIQKYYDKSKLIPSQMINGAIEGMVSSVGDPYTTFLPPMQNKIVNENLSGSFSGVGIEIGYKEGRLAVISPLPGSPAEKAGIKPGDFIVKITDKAKNVDLDSSEMSTSDAVTYIRGTKGTYVTLTLLREGVTTPIVVDIVREKISVPSVSLTWVGEGSNIANIKVSEFGSETKSEWNKAVSEIMAKSETKGIIIDLRNNPGGYMQSAIELASDFVPMNTVIVIQEEGDGSKQEYKSNTLPRLEKYRVVILINGGSASASEILSGALRDDRGVKLVGEKSFGKGTIQEPIDMTGGSGIHVTTAKWLTPKGTWVHDTGLTPDVEVINPDDATEDLQLKAAVELFK